MTDLLHRYQPVVFADSRDPFLNGVKVYGEERDISTDHNVRMRICQYWYAWPGDTDHAGIDWEHADIWIVDDQPGLVVCAQHRGGEQRPWLRVEKQGDRPVLYASKGKHALGFDRRWRRHGLHIDRCNARTRLELDLIVGVPVVIHKRGAYRDPVKWAGAL